VQNLGEIIERVKTELRGLPNIAATRVQLQQVVNEEHSAICEEYPWPFLVETRQMLWLPDITSPQTLAGGVIQIYDDPPPKSSSSQRVFTLGPTFGLFLEQYGTWTVQDSYAANEVLSCLLGSTLELADRSLLGSMTSTGNWTLAPFEVQRVFMSSQDPAGSEVYTNLPLVWLICDDRCNIQDMDLSEGELVLRFPRRLLPADVAAVQSVRRRDRTSPLTAITSANAHRLEENRAGDPEFWWLDTGLRPTWGSGDAIHATAHPPLSPIRRVDGLLGRRVEAPSSMTPNPTPSGFTVTAQNNGLSTVDELTPGKYKVRLAWSVAGRLSPPSETKEVTLTSAHDSILIDNIPERNLYWHGWVMTVWVSFNDGPFYMAQQPDVYDTNAHHPHVEWVDPVTTTIRTLPDVTIDRSYFDWGNPSAMIRWDDVYAGPDHRYLAIWPRPTEPLNLELTVLRRPRQLLQDTDAPHLPYGFNDLLMWRVVAKIAGVSHADSVTYETATRLAEKRLQSLKAKYGMDRAVRHQRAMIDGPVAYRETPFTPMWDTWTIDYRSDS